MNNKKDILFKMIYVFCFVLFLIFVKNIFLYYFFNTKEIYIPNVVNKDIEEAKRILDESKLKYIIIEGTSNEVSKNYVISQYPNPNEKVKSNRKIQIIVNSFDSVKIPDILGMPLIKAKIELEKLNIPISRIDYYPSENDNIILSTYPNIGEAISFNSGISLLVSSSKLNNANIMPDLIGLTYEQATQILSNSKHRITDISYVEDKTKEPDTILVTEPKAGAEIKNEYISVVLNKINKEEYNKDIETIIKENLKNIDKEGNDENIPSDKKD